MIDENVNQTEISVTNDQAKPGNFNTFTAVPTPVVSSSSSKLTKDYVNALFDELLPIVRDENPNLPSTLTPKDLRAILNSRGCSIHTRLARSFIGEPWIDGLHSWIDKQDKTIAGQLLSILFLVQTYKNHKVIQQLRWSAIHAIKRTLPKLFMLVDRNNISRGLNKKFCSTLINHFMKYVNGATGIAPLEHWLRSEPAYSLDKFLGAIEDSRTKHLSRFSQGIDEWEYSLWLWVTIYLDTFTRTF